MASTMTLGGILLSQGCDNQISVLVLDENGLPQDLTGYKARFRVSNKKMTARYIEITDADNPLEGSALIADPLAGVIDIIVKQHLPVDLPTNNEEGEEWILQSNNIYSVVLIETTTLEIIKLIQADCYTEAEL